MHNLKFILKVIFTGLIAFLLQFYLPWWSIAIAGLLISFILSSSGISSFFSGFLGISVYWGLLAFIVDNANNQLLSTKVAEIFSLPNSAILILITAFVGGLIGGFGALTGSQLRSLILPIRKRI